MSIKVKKILLILGTCFIVLMLFAFFAPATFRDINERRYRVLFMKLPEVESVQSYFDYDGLRFAKLNIRGDGYLSISGFDESLFANTEFIGIERIGDISIHCADNPKMYGGVLGIFNIVSELRKSPGSPRVGNIGDLVKNYKFAYAYVQRELPKDQASKKVVFNNVYYWCNSTREPTSRPLPRH